MKILFISFFTLITFGLFAQQGFVFQYPRVEITGVFNGELVKRETKQVRIGLSKETGEFVVIMNFDDFKLQNKETGEILDFPDESMKIHGYLDLNTMRENSNQFQTYKAELTIDFPNNTITSLFDVEIQYFKNQDRGFSLVRMNSELNFEDLKAGGINGFEDKFFVTLIFQVYQSHNYH